MKNKIISLLKQKRTVIGAVHFSPSPGFNDFDSVESAIKKAQADLDSLISGGVDAIIFENNYDLPHKVVVGHNTTTFMVKIICELKFKKKIPFGISVLWNDYEAALAIARVTGGCFIRIPAYVDTVRTNYGIVRSVSKKAISYRKNIFAEEVAIFADVHVKHAEMVNKKKTLNQSLVQAEKNGADAIIITGKWTGDAPVLDNLKLAKETVSIPIVVGSGASIKNINSLFNFADGVIVSTSLKSGDNTSKQINPNLKSINQRIDLEKVKVFISETNLPNK